MDEMKSQRISYELWPCLIFNDVPSSINASHKMIVSDAKERGLEEVCIGEDDLYFPHKRGWEWFLKHKPDVFDIYSGGSYLPFDKPKEPCAVRVKEIVGFHLYIIHSRYYDTFLNTDPSKHIDTEQKSDSMFVCWPMSALQRPGFSANNKAQCNYNGILLKEDIYQ